MKIKKKKWNKIIFILNLVLNIYKLKNLNEKQKINLLI